jgi:hypothetical protein
MIKLWSELRGARVKEQVADLLTIVWVVFWGRIVWQLFEFLSSFAEAGRIVRAGGLGMIQSGKDLGESLSGLPLVGEGANGVARDAFAGAGQPLSDFGTELEQFIFVVSFVIALMLALITIGWWLSRYLPWRAERLQRVRAAHKAIRNAPDVGDERVERALAMRAISRLEWADLLDYTPDPIGDWAGGRYERLARAELAEAGLRP